MKDRPPSGDGSTRTEQVSARQACTVLFDRLPALQSPSTEMVIRRLAGGATVQWTRAAGGGVTLTGGVVRFGERGEHRVMVVAVDAPVRKEVLERTVAVSPMPDNRRQSLLGHRAAVRLLYTGDAGDPVEELTALYKVAGALVLQGGLGILNERAALALPAELVHHYLPELSGATPPISLWVGAVTFPLDQGRYLMRTYGMDQMRLPDLAMYMHDRSHADEVYHVLINTCLYMVENRRRQTLGPGHRVDFKERTYLLTEPSETGPEFEGQAGLLLLVEV